MQAHKNVDDLLRTAREALRKNPKDANLHRMIAPVYESEGRFQEALQHLSFLVSSQAMPQEELYLRYAYALQRTGAFTQALGVLTRANAHYPDSKMLSNSLAMNYMLLGQYDKARSAYLELHGRHPSDMAALAMAGAMALLISGHKEGFAEYAARPLEAKEQALFVHMPQWQGESLAGKSIICWTEQGIGDAIMFIGFVPYLLSMGAKVTLAVNPRLKSLIERGLPGVDIACSSDQITGRSFDFQSSLGALMEHVLPHYQPSSAAPYLKADMEKSHQLRSGYEALAQRHGRKRLIGLAWHTTNHHIGYIRNIPLAEMKPLFSLPDIQFVVLQYGDHDQDIAEVNRQFKDILWRDPHIDAYNDLDGLAAQMMALDEVIATTNVTAHLAGSLGAPTTLLIPACPDWRWKQSGQSNSWYGSVKLERQDALLNWKPVIKRLRSRLCGE